MYTGGTSIKILTNMLKKPTDTKDPRHALRARCRSVASCCFAMERFTVGKWGVEYGIDRGRITENGETPIARRAPQLLQRGARGHGSGYQHQAFGGFGEANHHRSQAVALDRKSTRL